MKKVIFIYSVVCGLLFCGCKEVSSKEESTPVVESNAKVIKRPTEPIAEKEGTREYEATFGKHRYTILMKRTVDRQAPVVKDILGTPFYDNVVSISVKQDGNSFFDRVFKKGDFEELLSDEDKTYGTLAGMSFYEEASSERVLVFVAQVCMPGMDGGMHARVNLELPGKTLRIKLDDTPDLDITSTATMEEDGV